MSKIKCMTALLLCSVILSMMGCKCSVKVKASGLNDVKLEVSDELGEKLGETIVSLTGLVGDEKEGSLIFNKSEMEDALTKNGFASPSVKVNGRTGVEVSCGLGKSCVEGLVSNTADSLTVTLTPENVNALFASLGDDYMAYASLLMAPVFTGEKSTEAEYREILAAVYGDELADEIASSSIDLSLTGMKGKSKSYKVDLVDLLVLEGSLTYAVSNK